MRKHWIILLITLGSWGAVQAQTDANLALQYVSNGEFDKAADIYAKLYDDNPSGYYKPYYNCLMILADYKTIEKIAGKQIKKNPDNLTYYVDLGYAYEKKGDSKSAEDEYGSAVQKIINSRPQVTQLAMAFIALDKVKWAIQVYEKAQKTVTDYSFNYELAGMYYRDGQFEKSIDTYLDYYAEGDLSGYTKVTSAFQHMFDEPKDHELLQEKLIERIQKNKNEVSNTELLIWDYIQLKDFAGAFLLAKSLDKRYKENGERVFDLGESAQDEGDYDAAIECFNYVIAKGIDYQYYFSAKNGVLNCRKDKIFKTDNYTKEDIDALKQSYLDFLSEYPKKDARAATVTDDMAKLAAFYAHDVSAAINMLEPAVDWPGINAAQRAQLKLDLGDFYLISGDVWESTLLYSQVDKAMKDDPLGEVARFKNAKLAYYRGDFTYSQSLLDILKAATSELVANDAMQLSVFITENLGLDTIKDPMQLFANADLMVFQNNIPQALSILDTLTARYPGHALTDDVLFLKATIALKKQQIEEAVTLLETIRQNYAYDLLADDAIFKLAEIYEYDLKDNEKAQACYEQIILNYKDSLYVTEARKRYRTLRGDKLN